MGHLMMSEFFTCRACRSTRGELVLDLGLQPLANNLLRPEDLTKPEPRFPLRVFVCPDCWLLQLADLVPPVDLFTEYLYFSSFSDTMLRHARAAAEQHLNELHLGPQSLVVEVASNDGYLLQNFHRAGVPCLGIEPAANIAKVAREKGIETWAEFFGEQLARRLVAERGAADLIMGNNVFAHAPDINDFTAGLTALLKPDGRAVLEFPYGVELVEQTEFDTIYHEHVFYFTLTPLVPLFRRHGLEIFHVERLPIHGGSIRLHAARIDSQLVQSSVTKLLEEERAKGVNQTAFYRGFASQVSCLREDLLAKLSELKRQGQTIAAYGASAKGSTLLNYCALGGETLDFVADRSPHKRGRLTPGSHLPIVAPEELAERQPGHTLLLTWNFADEILEQQCAYRERGGKFIIPIPKVQTV
jgi:SAM-dependent methyltransferase